MTAGEVAHLTRLVARDAAEVRAARARARTAARYRENRLAARDAAIGDWRARIDRTFDHCLRCDIPVAPGHHCEEKAA